MPPNLIVNPTMYDSVPYDPYKDFDPVTVAVSAPTVLSIHPSLQVQSVNELVALIKSSGVKYSFASPGIGTPPHLIGEPRSICCLRISSCRMASAAEPRAHSGAHRPCQGEGCFAATSVRGLMDADQGAIRGKLGIAGIWLVRIYTGRRNEAGVPLEISRYHRRLRASTWARHYRCTRLALGFSANVSCKFIFKEGFLLC